MKIIRVMKPLNDFQMATLKNLNIVKAISFFSQYMDPMYYQIDESVEVIQFQASTASGDRNLPKCISNSSRNVRRSDDFNAQSSESHI